MNNLTETEYETGFSHEYKVALRGNRTGSAFRQHAQDLERARHLGYPLTQFERDQVSFALAVFGPENLYMDGELFA